MSPMMVGRVIRVATNRRVSGRALNEAMRDAREIAIGPGKAEGTELAYGYTALGYPHLDMTDDDFDAAIIVTVRTEQCALCTWARP